MNPTNCPYCNSPISSNDTLCPRCGERLGGAKAVPLSVSAMAESPKAERSSSWLKPFAIIAGLGILGVAAGVIYSQFSGDEPPPPRSEPEPIAVPSTVPKPSKWSGIGYLPRDCNTIVGVRPRQWLHRAGQQAAFTTLPKQVLNVENAIAGVGIHFRDLDEVLLAVNIKGAFEGTAVLTASRDFDLTRLKAAGNLTRQAGKDIYRLNNADIKIEVFIWAANPRTLVIADEPERFAGLGSGSGTDHLPSRMASLIESKLPDEALIWIIAHTADWSGLLRPIPFGAVAPNASSEDLAHLDFVTIGIEQRELDPILSAWFILDNPRTAGELSSHLKRTLSGEKGLELTTGGSGPEVFVRAQGSIEALQSAWKRTTKE